MTEEHRDSAKALEKALSLFHEASAVNKCRACGCFQALLRALANDGRFDGLSDEFTEAVIKAQECLTEMQYDCFGCEVLETSYDLYLPNTDRYKYPLPTQYGIRVQRKFLALMKKRFPCRYEKAVRALVYPALINVVVRKPESWKKPLAATKLPESGG